MPYFIRRSNDFLARRIELGREPDLDSIDHLGGKWFPLNVTRRSRPLERLEFLTSHPMVIFLMFLKLKLNHIFSWFSIISLSFSIMSTHSLDSKIKICIWKLFIHDDNSCSNIKIIERYSISECVPWIGNLHDRNFIAATHAKRFSVWPYW